MENWIKLEKDDFIYYIPRSNIAAVCIKKDKPFDLNIMMIGDEKPTLFTFQSNKLRNDKLDEIFQREKKEESNDEELS